MADQQSVPGLDPGDPGPSDPLLFRDPAFVGLLAGAHARLVGTPLAPGAPAGAGLADWLYEAAPFCLLAHNAAPDPRFVYANRAAQACFGYDWDEMTRLRSRLSAEAPSREERQGLIEAVRRDGFATGYRGLRISKAGRRFWIEDVTMWQLMDEAGRVRGQAAVYRHWTDA